MGEKGKISGSQMLLNKIINWKFIISLLLHTYFDHFCTSNIFVANLYSHCCIFIWIKSIDFTLTVRQIGLFQQWSHTIQSNEISTPFFFCFKAKCVPNISTFFVFEL